MKRFFSFFAHWYFFMGCIAVICWHSFAVIWASQRKRLTRTMVNKRLRKGAKQVLGIVRANYHVHFCEGFKLQPGVPYIFMSNHLSLFDLPLIYATLPGTIRIIGKKQIFQIPLFGKALLDAENLSIDQEHPEVMLNFYNTAQRALTRGISLWIFPEGTRSRTGKLRDFHWGGFRLAHEVGAQIVPVGITGTKRLLRAHTTDLHLGQMLYLSVGHPIDSKAFVGLEGQKQLMQQVREAILGLCKRRRVT